MSIRTFVLLLIFFSTAGRTEPLLIDPEQKTTRTRWLISSYVASVAFYGYSAWWSKDTLKHRFTDDGQLFTETVPNRTSDFRVSHEGWFDEDTPNGGADKLGHAYSAYLSTRLMTRGFQWAGYDHLRAAQIASLTTSAVMLGVEVMDGFTVEYGFSKEDLAMNLSGVGAAALFETYPQLDDLLDLRFYYWRSDDAEKFSETDPVSDYSGQKYLLVAKASGIPQLQDSWWRYFELVIGYGTKGYQPNPGQFEDDQPKKRFLYYGISLNLSELLRDTVFHKGDYPRLQKVSEGVLEYLQMPGTALLFDHLL